MSLQVEYLTDLNPDELVWVVPQTGEAARSYEDFLALVAEFNKHVWTCSYTGLQGLTYTEAIQSEKKVAAQLVEASGQGHL